MNDFLAELKTRLGNVEKNDVGKVYRREVDIDMLNAYRMINPESFWGIAFNAEMQKLMQKMWQNKPEQKMFLDEMRIKFCIQDNQDNSIARVMRADYASNVLNLEGDSFVVAFTKDKLLKLKNKDEAAFVMGHELSHLLYKRDLLDGYQEYAEETACDLNSLQLMADAGMNLESALSVDDLYEQKSEEMKSRREDRADFICRLDQGNAPTEHRFSIYKKIDDIKYRKNLIKIFINRVYLFDDRVTITYNSGDNPVTINDRLLSELEEKDENERVLFFNGSGPPPQQNPNLLPIGDGFGFVVFYNYHN